jgi:cytochrome c oxidase subunit 2
MNDLLRRMLFLPPQGSTVAGDVDWLHYFVIITTFILSTLVGLSAFYFFFRYRRRRVGQLTVRVEPKLWFEILIIGVPLAFFLIWAVIGYRDYIRIITPPANSIDVYVMAKKWMWKFAYPEGPNSIAVLRVPAQRPVRLLMTSRDVIHSFYVPDFRIKQDVVPGRYTQAWFEATRPGRYQILCAEYCGVGHSTMWGEVIAMPPDEFDAWMTHERRGLGQRRDIGELSTTATEIDAVSNLAVQGRQIAAAQGCLKCHSLDGSPHIGPTWLDLYGRSERLQSGEYATVDEGYITESMMDPRAKIVLGYDPVMPTFQGRITAPETAAVIEFIRSLRRPEPGAGPAVTSPPAASSRIGLPALRGGVPSTSSGSPSSAGSGAAGSLNQAPAGPADPARTVPGQPPPTQEISPPRENTAIPPPGGRAP